MSKSVIKLQLNYVYIKIELSNLPTRKFFTEEERFTLRFLLYRIFCISNMIPDIL